ncbi:4-hydroxy-tetrahydrodipicolinate synthase [Syntrophomonas erecta]
MTSPRLLTAMVTPYDAELNVDYNRARELARELYENDTEGIVVCGTTGESPVLTREEKLQMYVAVKEAVGDKIPVWAGTGSNDTKQSIELSREAEKLGVSGIMLVTPYYNKPSQEGLYQHFKTVAESVSLPVMLYNVPGRTGANLLPDTVNRLADIDNIVAVKEASGNMDQVSLLVNKLAGKILVYSGDDSMTLPMMAVGVHGVVSVASHIVGKELRSMIQAFVDGDMQRAAQLHHKLFSVFKGLFIISNPVPVKEALNMQGRNVGGVRLPLARASESEQQFIRQLLQSNGLL